MFDKTQVTKVAMAGFGAALASVYAIPEAHATIIPISFNPGAVAHGMTSANVSAAVSAKTASGAKALSFLFLKTANTGISTQQDLGARSRTWFAFELAGNVLTNNAFNAVYGVGKTNAVGTNYVGFRTQSGNLGWFQVNWGGFLTRFLKGAINTDEGGPITVGQMSSGVPEPSELGLMALGLLALGAAGVRMRREAHKAAQLN